MKRLQLIVSLSLFSIAVAQKPIIFRDNAKNPKVTIQGNQGFLIPGNGPNAPGSFELTGNVQIQRAIKDAETLMTCGKASGIFFKKDGTTEVDKVRMTDGIHFTQKGKTSSVDGTGSSADYDIKDTLKEVTISGDVKVSFEGTAEGSTTKKDGTKTPNKTNSTMTTTSKSATITFKTVLDDKKNETSEIQTAVVRGPIHMTGVQLVRDADGEKLQKVTAKADQLRYTIRGDSKNPEVTLEGNLEFQSVDATGEGATVDGGDRLVLELNKKNEIIKLKFIAPEGKQVKSTVFRGDAPKKVDEKSKKKNGGA
jgi:hypothetical protein